MESIVATQSRRAEPGQTHGSDSIAENSRRRLRAIGLAIIVSALALAACGKSPEQIESAFQGIEKGSLASEVRDRLGEPDRIETSPQIPDLEHWKYLGGKLTVSVLQGRVLGKFDAGPINAPLPDAPEAPAP